MPFYGDVHQFKLAVLSVQNQAGDWRLQIIDDQYPSDEPRRFIEALDDERIVYMRNTENLGISGNFRRAVTLASANYVVIMGCDDIMLPGYIELTAQLAEEFPEASYIQPGVAVIDEGGRRVLPPGDRVKKWIRPRGPRPLLLGGEELASSLMRGNWTYFPSLCWRSDVLKNHEFREDFDIVLDLALQVELILHDGHLLVDDRVVFEYRRHSASASSWGANGKKRLDEEKALFSEAGQRFAHRGWRRAARAARWHLTSRLNAATTLPGALLARDRSAAGALLRHVVTTARPR